MAVDYLSLKIGIFFFLVLLNGIFVMAEMAIMSARKGHLQQLADEGLKAAQQALDMGKMSGRMISTIQVGISFSGILVGALSGLFFADALAVLLEQVSWLKSYSYPLAFVLIVLLTTLTLLVLGEILPKWIALSNPDGLALSLSPLMYGMDRVFAPFSNGLNGTASALLKILRLSDVEDNPVTQEEIKNLMEQATQEGLLEESEQDMVTGVLRLGNRYVNAVMTPRTAIVWLDLDDSFEEIFKVVRQNHFSFYPVSRGSLDNVVGLLDTQTFLSACLDGQPVDIQSLMIKPLYIPETKLALEALEMIKSQGASLGVVIDEYGGLLGMVTLFDILESIVGDLPDQDDLQGLDSVQRADGSWLLDGMLPVDELKEILSIMVLGGEERIGFQTLAGFVMSQFGYIPAAGAHFVWERFNFEVVDMDGRRVDKVLVTPTDVTTESKTANLLPLPEENK
jgi:putative hemolysin